MKTLLFVVLMTIPLFGSVSSKTQCDGVSLNIDTKWLTMDLECKEKMAAQVQTELNAAMTYLAMGAHFSKDRENRPGFAKFFFESASEEREHAIKIISYLLMRTNPADYLKGLISEPKPLKTEWTSGVDALENALSLETNVTVSIRDIISSCEGGTNDYHLVDYLSGEFLDEQYKGQRELAGMISTLQKMTDGQGVLGEYLFDKKLLNNELF
ncbi:ferritin heavy chain [Hetaerina americana]|uniref:ferritin heavy chain n=1 Tax=Hetaerina americana TaxID=62018 RepID=UPI003A7F60D7